MNFIPTLQGPSKGFCFLDETYRLFPLVMNHSLNGETKKQLGTVFTHMACCKPCGGPKGESMGWKYRLEPEGPWGWISPSFDRVIPPAFTGLRPIPGGVLMWSGDVSYLYVPQWREWPILLPLSRELWFDPERDRLQALCPSPVDSLYLLFQIGGEDSPANHFTLLCRERKSCRNRVCGCSIGPGYLQLQSGPAAGKFRYPYALDTVDIGEAVQALRRPAYDNVTLLGHSDPRFQNDPQFTFFALRKGAFQALARAPDPDGSHSLRLLTDFDFAAIDPMKKGLFPVWTGGLVGALDQEGRLQEPLHDSIPTMIEKEDATPWN